MPKPQKCAFCGRRCRGDYVEVSGRIYHYAGPDSEHHHRHCAAAGRHRAEKLGIRPTLYSDQPQKEVRT